MIAVTLDTSVYIRALHLGGPASSLIGHARAGNIRIDISGAILSKTNRVLRDKFQWYGYMLHDARSKLLALGNRVNPVVTLSVIKEDPLTTGSSNARLLQIRTTSSASTQTCCGWSDMRASEL